MTSRRILLFVMVASVCVLQGCMLHQSAAGIRDSLLKRTPVGTDYESVAAIVKAEGWQWQPHSWIGPPGSHKSKIEESAAGSLTNNVHKIMVAHLGDYGVLPVSQWEVFGYWLFNSNDDLIDICVFKRLISL